MMNLSSEEREEMTSDQEKEYLLLQEELLADCKEEDIA